MARLGTGATNNWRGPGIEPAKPAKIGPPAVAVGVFDLTPIVPVVAPRTTPSQASRERLRYLAGRWIRERCVVTRLCASSLRTLGRYFFEWAKLVHDAATEQLFAEELLQRGFAAYETGMVCGLVLMED